VRTKVWSENLEGRDLLGDRGVDEVLALKQIWKKNDVNQICLEWSPVESSDEHKG
jgi:hypothetical protein